MNTNKKIIFLTYIPSPYRVDFFNELSKFVDLSVIYYEKGLKDIGWKETKQDHNYKKEILFEKGKLKGYVKLLRTLYANKNNVFVIGGYAMLPEIITIFFLKLIQVKFIINSDGGFITKGFIKTKIKKVLIKSAYYWFSSGINTTNTLQYYGANFERIYEYPFTSLSKKDVLSKAIPKKDIDALKKIVNLKPNTFYIVYVGQLIERKGLDVLIESMTKIKTLNLEVLIIGDGVLSENLKELVKASKLIDRIQFLGKKSKEDVLAYLKVSDLFVLPSRDDIWGLVVNEAIANGLAIISTKNVGASYSLIKDNGYIIEPDNANVLSNAIDNIFTGNLIGMKNKSIEIAKEYTIENMVSAHLKLFNTL